MKLSEELQWRGFVSETTLDQISDLDKAPRNFYWGADPSADSLTIGNLAALMMCACFIRHGYTPYFLVGGATGQIGDPKDNGERDLKSLDEVEHNKKCIGAQIKSIARTENAHFVDNFDWFKDINYLSFLREVGKAFSMTQLLDRQFIQARIGEGGSGISYAEFSYTLIQGYDFLHLFRTYNVDLQLCGADQFGNCASGIHLIKRLEGKKADSYACPLIIDPVSGRKFGKSEGNAVWLASSDNGSGNFTSVFDFYQFWLNQPDQSLETFFKIYTTIMPNEFEQIMAKHNEDPSARYGQKRLAYAVTEVVHGTEAAESAQKISTILFGDGKLDDLTNDDIELFAQSFPTAAIGTSLIDVLVSTSLASSKGEARKLISGNAISLNGAKITEDQIISNLAIIKKGKNKFALVK